MQADNHAISFWNDPRGHSAGKPPEEVLIQMPGLHHNERRDFIRMEMDTGLSFKRDGSATVYSGRCLDLSHTGMQIETETVLSTGERIAVSLDLGNPQFEPMRAHLEVLRVEERPDGGYLIAGKILDIG